MTPQTDRAWAKALAAVHPDVGGDVAVFLAIQKQREAWSKARPHLCAFCRVRPVPTRKATASNPNRYCSVHCSARARAEARKGHTKLTDGRRACLDSLPDAVRVARAGVNG
jgi:hypothetical protein